MRSTRHSTYAEDTALTFTTQKSMLLLLALAGVASSVSATPAASAIARVVADPVARSAAVPAALRPVLYQTLAKNAGSAYHLGSDGCATLPKSALKGCFDVHGAHFSGSGIKPIAMRLVGFGRGDQLAATPAIAPKISGNGADYPHHGITEWWRAMPLGYEQGFTVAQRPAGQGELTVALAASRGAQAKGDGLAWNNVRYGGLSVLDSTGKLLPATLRNTGNRILIAVDDAGAAYPLTIDPTVWVEQKVTADDGVAGDVFGFSVAIDGNTALIGAVQGAAAPSGVDNGGAGAVYVFTQSGGTWTQTQELAADDGADNDQFGYAVALHGDTAVIGAAFAAINGNTNQGAAYVFTNAGGTWTQTQKLVADDGAAADQLGWSVALDGDIAVLGAHGATIAGNFAQGAAYVFTASGGSWSQTAKLTADDGIGNDQLGYAVALHGDTAVVTAPNATVGANAVQGAAYLYTNSGGVWTQAQKLFANDGTANENFGFSVAFDGVTALVSSPFATVGANMFQGAVYAFNDIDGTWTQAQKIVADDGQLFDVFGIAVGVNNNNAVITAPFFNGSQGTAYLFSYSGDDGWVQQQKFLASDAVAGEGAAFGYAGAISDSTILIGQALASTNFDPSGSPTYEGAAYFYSQPPSDVIFADGFDGAAP